MRTVLDEDVPHQLRIALAPRHDVTTTTYMGWAGVKNGALLKLIEEERYDVFVTGDKNLENQQQLLQRPFAIVVLSAVRWKTIRDHVPAISDAIEAAKRGTVTKVECGRFLPSKFRRDPPRSS